MSNVIQLELPVLPESHEPEEQEIVPRYIDFPEKFEVGQRIHCILYGGKDGTIIAIHGEQQPSTIRSILGGAGVMGGNASLDIAWDSCGERGGFSRGTPESIARGVQWRMLSGHKDPAKAIAEAELFVAQKEAEALESKKRFEEAMVKIETVYPYLVKDDQGDYNIVQKNLRALLKNRFPKTKFRVIKDGYSARRVLWTDGPTKSEVIEITNLFEEGSFNGMEDIYEYNASPFNRVFGGCKYVFEERDFSDDFVSKAIDEVWKQYQTMFKGFDKPTVEMYRKGGMSNIRAENSHRDFSDFLWEYLSQH